MFTVKYDGSIRGGVSLIENVMSCAFLCVSRDGTVYTKVIIIFKK